MRRWIGERGKVFAKVRNDDRSAGDMERNSALSGTQSSSSADIIMYIGAAGTMSFGSLR